ncbi:MAG TPA: FAD-dependent monooxygenase [Steroidobacteraceae bacterium]|jgi:aklavinone 12-hydroxylase
MKTREVPVLIVGSGLSGLTAAVMLSWRGVPVLLAERHAGPLQNPRARGVNLRSMELLRVAGLEPDLVAAGGHSFEDFTIHIAETVTGRQLQTLMPRGAARAGGEFDLSALSPARPSMAGQNRVEPILRRHAESLGAELRYSTEVVSVEQDAQGVSARVRDLTSGEEQLVRAQYLIAADGHRSGVRTGLGIGTHGYGTLSHNVAVVFEGNIEALIGEGRFALYYLQNPRFTGVFVNADEPRMAVVGMEYDPSRESPRDFDETRALRIVRDVLGVPEFEAKVLEVQTFELASQVADEVARGRVFMIGDAAHTMPPTGGLGGQTAMQDGYDIAWKLAMVLHGDAGPALLDTYAAERKPVAEMTVARQLANYVERLRPDRAEVARHVLESSGPVPDYMSVAFGYRYRSAAILAEAPDDGAPAESPSAPSGRPGTRAPHVVFEHRGTRLSSLDLIGRDFVLLCGPGASGWARAGMAIGWSSSAPLTVYRVGADLIDVAKHWPARFGVSDSGAVLLRPDGFIAWRSPGAANSPSEVLAEVLARVLCRTRESMRESAAA